MKKFLLCLAVGFLAVSVFGAPVEYKVKHTGNFVFFGTKGPVIDVDVFNNYRENIKCEIKCTISTDKGAKVYGLTQYATVLPEDSTAFSFSFYSPEPGFFKVLLEDGDNLIKEFNICYEPEKIFGFYPDNRGAEPFWEWAKKRSYYKLPEYKATKIKEKYAKFREAYTVSMKFPSGEVLNGYYFIPVLNKDSAIVRARLLYGSEINLEKETRYTGNCIDFVLPIKGINNPDSLFYTNTLHKYIAAVDFLFTRKELANRNIVATGEGFAGGMALALAAMDSRIKAVAVYNPFLDEATLKSESNILLGRITPLVKCPVLIGMGLQDSIATPRRLFDVYNLMRTTKEYFIFPFTDSKEDVSWDVLKNNFLNKY